LLVASIVLVACGPTAAPPAEEEAPPAEEEAAPAEEEAATEEEAAPAEEETVEFVAPTLLTETLGTADDLAVTDDEIATAVANLESTDSFVGIVACTFANEWHFTVADSARQAMEDYGLSVEMVDANLDAETQISAIENFVASGAKIIVVCLFDPPSVESALQEAADAGVYIIQYAGRDAAAFGGVSISIEDRDLGLAAGQYAGQLITEELGGEANVVILDYPDLPNVVVRADGIEEALLAEAPDATIVGRFLGGTTEFGLASMESALQANPDINVVVSINDAGAYGAMQALETAGYGPDDAIIVGIDAEEQALTYIAEGGMYRGTVDTAPARTGEMVADAAVKLLAGATFPQNIAVPVNLVTADNVGEFLGE
jgi:ribose transport system substrate-binding protein